MGTVGIFYFSGTGNTKLVAEMIREEFINNEFEVDLIRIEDVLKGSEMFDPGKYNLIGIGCQVIGYSTPNLILSFIQKMPKVKEAKVFVFMTAGGVAPINYNASNPLIKKLSHKGYKVFHERMFSIGSNWIVKFEDTIMQQLYLATKKKAVIMSKEVIAGQQRVLKTGLKFRIINGITSPVMSFLIKFMGKDLKVNSSCTNCGLCVRNCPAGNIIEKNRKIKFKWSCSGCLRCVYSCPKNAVNFKYLTFIPVSGGYNVDEVVGRVNESSLVNLEKVKVPPFFYDYIRNDAF